MGKTTLDRRTVLAGTAAVTVAAVVPAMPSATLGPSFVVMLNELERTMAALDAARAAVVAAQPRIFAEMRGTKRKLDAYFGAPEIKARSQARMAARAAAEAIMFTPASNESENALQAQTKMLFFTRLGNDSVPRNSSLQSLQT